ncbi:diaminopimelate epimerase [Chloroflexota bacterium]
MHNINFTKLQGTGNDFVLIDAREIERDWQALARAICHRHFGVGADGLLLLLTSERVDFRLRMFNPDGSEAEACGNGLRCFTRYLSESGLANRPELNVETMAGIRTVWPQVEKGIRVTLGVPRLAPADIPVIIEGRDTADTTPVLDYPVTIAGRELRLSCLSMGNPHAVCYLDKPVDEFSLSEFGPMVEHHRTFPNRVNFEVVNVISRSEIRARVWERGVGETLACGSGACAIAVTSRLKGLVDNTVDIILPGGTLTVEWDGTGEVLLSGPAEVVFQGEWGN